MSLSESSSEALDQCIKVLRPALLLAPTTYLEDIRNHFAANGIQDAVARRDPARIFDWIVQLINRQGISNSAAIAFAASHGSARWHDVHAGIADRPLCSKLKSWWHFEDCGYRKEAESCARVDLLPLCPLPRVPARKGALNQAAFGLALFIRDVCDGDIAAWIDERLALNDPGRNESTREALMRSAVLDPLVNIAGTGPKVWSMILAELLLGADPQRERWVATGASFIAVDSLVHAFLHRTGTLRRFGAEHPYGATCYAPSGCADVIGKLAAHIDAREFNAEFPACFPRWIQFAIWWFCAAGGWSICNSNQIDDRRPCEQAFCPAFSFCNKMAIKPHA